MLTLELTRLDTLEVQIRNSLHNSLTWWKIAGFTTLEQRWLGSTNVHGFK